MSFLAVGLSAVLLLAFPCTDAAVHGSEDTPSALTVTMGPWRRARSRRLISTGHLVTPNVLQPSSQNDKRVCPGGVHLDTAHAVCTAHAHHWNLSSMADLLGHANAAGAYSRHNQLYDATRQGRWYIEEQLYGILFIQAGLAFNNTAALEIGMRVFDWGFQQQQQDGSFDCPDRYHSSGFFLEAVARAALLLRASPHGNSYKLWLRRAEAHTAALADWFLDPAVDEWAWGREARHTHRRYLTGTALGLTGVLTRNGTLIDLSRRYIVSGMRQQDPEGFNHERGGYDCSYQAIGLIFAARYYLYVAQFKEDDSVSKVHLLHMGRRGATWLVRRIQRDGTINTMGNTRTGLRQEKGRNGRPKAVAKREISQALLYWGWILNDPTLVEAAWRVELQRTGVEPRPCECRLDPEGEWVRRAVRRCERGLCAGGARKK